MTPARNEGRHVLEVLRAAVIEALERKRRLGQYAIIWHNGRAVRLEPWDTTPTAVTTRGHKGA